MGMSLGKEAEAIMGPGFLQLSSATSTEAQQGTGKPHSRSNTFQNLQAQGKLLKVGCGQMELALLARSCLQLALRADRPGLMLGLRLKQPATCSNLQPPSGLERVLSWQL